MTVLFFALFAAAVNIVPIYEHRPVVDVTVEKIFEAAASPNAGAMQGMIDTVRKLPNAKSVDFHSFAVDTNNNLIARFWPMRCTSSRNLLDRSPLPFTTYMLDDTVSADGPAASVVFHSGTCITTLVGRVEPDSVTRLTTVFAQPGQRVSTDTLSKLLSSRPVLRKSAPKVINQRDLTAIGEGYILSWRSLHIDGSITLRFDTKRSCLTKQWFTNRGLKVENVPLWGWRVFQKGQIFASIAMQPEKPKCVSTMRTGA